MCCPVCTRFAVHAELPISAQFREMGDMLQQMIEQRIGQHQNVLVHRFITKNTFEERIDQMIQDKRHLADMTVASGESWIGKLSNSELREIFR